MKNRFHRVVAATLIVCTTGLTLPMPASAAVVGTDAVLATSARDRLNSSLAREDVRSQLGRFGVKPADVQARLDAMSDDEVAQLSGKIDQLPAGGDGIIGALVFIFVLLLVTDLLGLTKVFPFTHRVR